MTIRSGLSGDNSSVLVTVTSVAFYDRCFFRLFFSLIDNLHAVKALPALFMGQKYGAATVGFGTYRRTFTNVMRL